MNTETLETKTLEFNLLRDIINNNYRLPVDFCLKQFLGWSDEKIKAFNKEQKRNEKALLKRYVKAQAESSLNGEYCGNACQGE